MLLDHNGSINPYSLSIDGFSAENFSVVSFISQYLHFNSGYVFKIKIKRRQEFSFSACLQKRGILNFGHQKIHGIISGIVSNSLDNHSQESKILEDEIILSSFLSILNIKPKSAVYADCDFIKLMTLV